MIPATRRDVVLMRPRDGHTWRMDPLLESMGMGYLAAVLRRDGATVEVIDNYFEGLAEDALLERLLAWSTPLLGVSISHQYPNMWPLFEMLGHFKARRPQTLVVAGGQFVSFEWQTLLERGLVDAVAIGEGEALIVALHRCIRDGWPLERVPGVAFRRAGEIVRTPPGPLPDLDALPFPHRDYLERIHACDPGLAARAWHNVSRSRGCYAACSYCSVAAFARLGGGPKWRTRSPASVIAELRSLRNRFGVRRVRFTDDEFVGFGPDGERATLAFAHAMIAADLDVDFMVSMRVDHAVERLLAPLRRAGLRMALLGVEAGNREDLKLYRKGTRVDQNARAIDTMVACDVDVVLALILFNPWSTMDRIRESLKLLAAHCGPRVIMEPLVLLNKLTPLSGTSITERFRAAGLPTDLFLHRGPLPEYPFLDPVVDRYYRTCERGFKKHALAIDIAVSDADLGLEGLRSRLAPDSFARRERLFTELRHALQRALLDALLALAAEPDPEAAAPAVERGLLARYVEGVRGLRILTELVPAPAEVPSACASLS
jgi:anaerobic magnesium-protoporphyrin IX monomethyl ester cyclase